MEKSKKRAWIIALVMTVMMSVFWLGCGEDEEEDIVANEIYGVGCEVVYDGEWHGIEVMNVDAGDEVLYSADGVIYNGSAVGYVMPGEYRIYYKVTHNGEVISAGSAEVKIAKAVLTGIGAEDKEVVYDGMAHGIEIRGTEEGDEVTYSEDGERYTREYEKTDAGEYAVYYRVERSYGEYTGTTTLRILPDLSGRYVEAESGEAVLTKRSCIIDGKEYPMKYGIDGTGEIDGRRFAVSEGVFSYEGKTYTKLKDTEKVYSIDIGMSRIYIASEDGEKIELRFDVTEVRVFFRGEQIYQAPGYNYVEEVNTEIQRSYETSDIEISIDKDIEIQLSKRQTMNRENLYKVEIYDGKEHSWGQEGNVKYKAGNEYTDNAPSYKDIGKYETTAVILDDGYLPTVITLTMEIIQGIDGIYYNDDSVVKITGFTAEYNGREEEELTYKDGKWSIELKNYTKLGEEERLFYIDLFGEITVVNSAAGNVTVTVRSEDIFMTVSVTNEKTELASANISKAEIIVTYNNKQLRGILNDTYTEYIVGMSELNTGSLHFISVAKAG